MNIISLVSGLIKLAGLIMEWMERRRLISQGRKEQMNESLLAYKDKIDIASRARDSVKSDPASLRDDSARRD